MGTIRFPNLGIEFSVGKSFFIGGLEIAYYGITMALAMICGALIAYHEAKRTGQNVDDYVDYTIFGIVGGVICARLYYVAFEWDYYSKNLKQIFNLRGGGIAIYGGVIGAVLVAIIICKIKKIRFLKFVDTAVFGLVAGQIIGRWGNFFNREAYGSYTNNIFAMQIPVKDATVVTDAITVVVNGAEYVQVHPTFLYEGTLNLILLILLIIFRDKRKFYGETFCRYLMGYGVIRFFVEGLRTDQLQLKGIAVSQVLSIVLFALALGFIIYKRIKFRGRPSEVKIPVKAKNAEKEPVDALEVSETVETAVEDATESVKAAKEDLNETVHTLAEDTEEAADSATDSDITE